MGDSFANYNIRLHHVKRFPVLSGTSLWSGVYIHDTIEVSDTERFNSSYIENSQGGIDTCRPKINIIHEYDFIELDNINRMISDFKTNGSDSFGIFVVVEINDLRTDEGYSWSSRNYYNPFWGENDTHVKMELDLVTYDVDPINTFLRFGVLFMGVGFWLIALASTPYWDPFVQRMQRGNKS